MMPWAMLAGVYLAWLLIQKREKGTVMKKDNFDLVLTLIPILILVLILLQAGRGTDTVPFHEEGACHGPT